MASVRRAGRVIDELGVRFQVDLLEVQDTFDQTENRRFAAGLCRDRDVLDVYAKTSAWSMHALRAGAKADHPRCLRASCAALEANAELNGVSDVKILCDEPKRGLQQMSVSACASTPSCSTPRLRQEPQDRLLRSYGELNALGMSVLKPGGFLFTSSSSYHIDEGRFVQVVYEAPVSPAPPPPRAPWRAGPGPSDGPGRPGEPIPQVLRVPGEPGRLVEPTAPLPRRSASKVTGCSSLPSGGGACSVPAIWRPGFVSKRTSQPSAV